MGLKVASAQGRKPVLPKPVQNPWQISADEFPADGTSQEQLWHAIGYATLAPSTHNTQPWRFVINDRHVQLWADLSRSLPVVDPNARELVMSCGAALFQLRLALAYFGIGSTVDLFPSAEQTDWVARLSMGAKAECDGDTVLLFQAITERRTNRHRFQERPVPDPLLEELENAAEAEGAWLRIVEGDEDRAAVADLVAEGDRRQWADKAFRKELAGWVRPAGAPNRDGLPVATQELGSVMSHAGPFVIRTFDLGKGHAAKDRDIALHSPVLAVLGTDTDDPVAWVSAGQALARVLLRAQSEGVSASFLNQPIEVPELRPILGERACREGFPQCLLRMGYGDAVPHTPRRSMNKVVSVKG